MLHAGSSSDKTHLKIGLNFTLAPLLANCIRSGPLRGSDECGRLCQLVETEAERRQEKASLRTRRTDFG
jgi:hypothetical protein